jgi:hypothetical protein
MLNSTATDAPRRPNPSSERSIVADVTRTERLARTLAPTVYCPEARVEECVNESKPGVS